MRGFDSEAIRTRFNSMCDIILDKFLYESNLIEDETSKEAHEDAKKAWNFIISYDKLTPSVVLQTHKILMERLAADYIVGKWRDRKVTVDGLMMPAPFVAECKVVSMIEEDEQPTTALSIRQWHIAFERLHPFLDGNGRIGRIIMNWHHVKANILPIVIYNKQKEEYYKWFHY